MPPSTHPIRARTFYVLSACSIVLLGLFWRSRYFGLGTFLQKYGGDALWAALVFALIRFCRPQQPTLRAAWIALAISVSVELSQLYHAPWLDAIRSTRLGALALGSTFNWPDIPSYAIGIVLAAAIDYTVTRSIPREAH